MLALMHLIQVRNKFFNMKDVDWSVYLLQVLGQGEPFGFFDSQGVGVSLERGGISPYSNTNIVRVSVLSGEKVETVIDFHFPEAAYTYLALNFPIKSAKKIEEPAPTSPPISRTKAQENTLIFM